MMTVLRVSALALALSLTLSSLAANAQRASVPAVTGQSVKDVNETLTQLRAANAKLTSEVSELRTENAELTGRLETLEFMMRQIADETDRLQSDDKIIGERLSELDTNVSDLSDHVTIMQRQVQANAGFAQIDLDTDESIETGTGVEGIDVAKAPQNERLNGPADLRALNASPPTVLAGISDTPAAPSEIIPPVVEDPQALFTAAKSKLQAFDYAGAEAGFRTFLETFADDPQASEAQYWLGEVLYQQEAHAESGAAYTAMIEAYPDDIRAPDALWKLARSLRLIGDATQACAILDVLPGRYPNASSVTRNYANRERALSSCGS